jgi:hypothetical protein
MLRVLLPLLLFVAGETAAFACSCRPAPIDPAEKRTLARDMARGAVALVEVRLVAPVDPRRRRGERLRVLRILAGSAPAVFEVEWRGNPSSAACQETFDGGFRKRVLLYRGSSGGGANPPRFRVSSTCTNLLLHDDGVRAATIEAMRRRR